MGSVNLRGLHKEDQINFKEVHLFLKRSLYAPVWLFRLLGAVIYQDLLYSGLKLASTYTSSNTMALPEILEEINTVCILT